MYINRLFYSNRSVIDSFATSDHFRLYSRKRSPFILHHSKYLLYGCRVLFFFIVVGFLSCQRFVTHLFLLNRVCVQKRYRLPSSHYPRSSFCYSRSLTQLSKFPAKGVICLHLVSIHSHSDSDGPDSFLSPPINSSLYLSRQISPSLKR